MGRRSVAVWSSARNGWVRRRPRSPVCQENYPVHSFLNTYAKKPDLQAPDGWSYMASVMKGFTPRPVIVQAEMEGSRLRIADSYFPDRRSVGD